MKKLLVALYKHIFKPLLKRFKTKTNRPVQLPRDDAFIPGQDIQWWYWTGHLRTEDGKRFGFEIVFFVFDSWFVFKNILAQASITNVDGKEYKFIEHLSLLKLPKKLENKFELCAEKNGLKVIFAEGGNGFDRLSCVVDSYTLDIELASEYEPTLHYGGDIHHYCYGGNTYYYSREKMKTKGKILQGSTVYDVTGSTWFDRQYGELYQSIFKGWQWFAIELYDGTNIMVYDYRKEYAEQENFASISRKGKTSVHKTFSVEILGEWKSPHTGINYPHGWRVTIAEYTLTVMPLLADQELRANHTIWVGPEYWEGDCSVTNSEGEEIGDAYVELNGYGNKLFSLDGGIGF